MSTSKSSEAALADVAKDYLRDLGWNLFEEVPFNGWIVDIVGTGDAGILSCEVKLSLGFPVITQGKRIRDFAHYSWIAVPAGKLTSERQEALDVCAWRGIGVLEIREISKTDEAALRRGAELSEPRVKEIHRAVRQSPVDHGAALRAACAPQHQTHAKAGTKSGTAENPRWTRTEETREAVREYLEANGRTAPIDAVVRALKAPWIILKAREGKIPRVRLNGSGLVEMLELVEPGNEAPVTDRSSRTAKRDRTVYG